MTEEIDLTYGELTPESLDDAIGDLNEVRALDLSGNNISSEYCIELADRYLARMPNLQSLDIKDNSIGPKGAIHLFEVLQAHCPKLTYLDVNENAIQDEALFALAVLVKASVLETVNAVTNHITPRGLPTLCDGVVANHTIRELSLAFNVLGDEGTRIAADMLGRHPTLQVLNLSDNGIGDEGAVALASAFLLPRSARLTHLDLSVNHIGDIGFQALGEALAAKSGNPHFTHLDLGCNDTVTDAGRAALVGFAPRMRSVQSIDLTSCNLADEDAQALARAIRGAASSLAIVEWFNNPRMSLNVEKELFEAIQAKTSAAEAAEAHRFAGLTPTHVAAAVVCVATVALAVTITRRRRVL